MKGLRFQGFSAVAVITVAAATMTASAGFTNFGPGGSFDGTAGHSITGVQHKAMGFQTTLTGNVVQIQIGLLLQSGPFTTGATISLHSDAEGAPGGTLGTWTAFGMMPPGPNAPPVTLQIANGPLLTAGEQYWLSVSLPITSQAQLLWGFNSIGDMGPSATAPFGGSWTPTVDDTRGAFSVVVPGPASLAVIALAGIAGPRRRRL